MIKKNFYLIFNLCLVGIFVLSTYSIYNNLKNSNLQQSNDQSSSASSLSSISSTSSSVSSTPKPLNLSMNTMFFGDVFWGRYIDDWSKKSNLQTAYPFSGLNTLEREKYDAWIADMECPITTTYLDSAFQDNNLKFSCPTEYTKEAANWFNAFTLANNHMDNMQEVEGLKQTRDNLDKNGIQYFGHFEKSNLGDICEVVSLPAKLNLDNSSIQKVDFPVALCGFHNVFKLPTDNQIAQISLYSKYFPTIVMPHQGKEYTYKADSLQEQYAHKYIEAGADAVIGDHVHSVQNTEVYQGKLIVYSTGNFIFDQQAIEQVRQGIGVNLNFSFNYDLELQKYLQIGSQCKVFKDDCLNTATVGNYTKPKFSILYDVIPTDNSGKLAKKADPIVATKILKLVNWDKTKKELGQ